MKWRTEKMKLAKTFRSALTVHGPLTRTRITDTDTQNHFDLLATVPLHKDNSKQDVKRK